MIADTFREKTAAIRKEPICLKPTHSRPRYTAANFALAICSEVADLIQCAERICWFSANTKGSKLIEQKVDLELTAALTALREKMEELG